MGIGIGINETSSINMVQDSNLMRMENEKLAFAYSEK